MKSPGFLHRSLYALAGLIAIGICAAAIALLWMDRRMTCRCKASSNACTSPASKICRAAPRPGDEVAALVEAADAAVYRAKEAGRNRVVAAGR